MFERKELKHKIIQKYSLILRILKTEFNIINASEMAFYDWMT